MIKTYRPDLTNDRIIVIICCCQAQEDPKFFGCSFIEIKCLMKVKIWAQGTRLWWFFSSKNADDSDAGGDEGGANGNGDSADYSNCGIDDDSGDVT